jgi:hypothetical protein
MWMRGLWWAMLLWLGVSAATAAFFVWSSMVGTPCHLRHESLIGAGMVVAYSVPALLGAWALRLGSACPDAQLERGATKWLSVVLLVALGLVFVL